MAKRKRITLKDVFEEFKKTQVIYLATIEGKKPRVRPVTLIHHDKKLWVATYAGDAKIRQIRRNPRIEFCLLLKRGKHNGYIRGCCRAFIIKSRTVRRKVAKAIPLFKHHWKTADEPSFCLLRLLPRQFEYLVPGRMSVEHLKA